MGRWRACVGVGRVLLVSLCVAGTLGACGPRSSRADSAGTLVDVVGHLEDASSAVATGRLAFETATTRRLPAVTADQAVSGAVETATEATHDLAALVPPAADLAAAELHDQALAVTTDAVRALARTRVALGSLGVQDAEATFAVLDDAQAALDEATAAARARVGS